MLVITRKTGEGVIIADNIEIVVLEVNKDRIKLGIEAPKEIKIVRNEIYNTEEENRQANVATSVDIIRKIFKGNGE